VSVTSYVCDFQVAPEEILLTGHETIRLLSIAMHGEEDQVHAVAMWSMNARMAIGEMKGHWHPCNALANGRATPT
jgi:hypothetical protein